MIIALASKLLVALWKYATAGVLIEGAILKPAWARCCPLCLNLPGPDQSRRIQGDEPQLTMAWKSRCEEWSRPPELSPAASGMLVQLPRAATECEFDLVPEPGQVMQRARTSDAKQHRSTQGGRPMNPLREIDRIAPM